MSRDENVVFAEYQAAADELARQQLQDELITLLRKHAFAVCWLLLRETRPDLVNYAVLKALTNADNFRGEAKFSTWFHHIVQNLCRDEGRLRNQRREISLEELGEGPEVTPQVLSTLQLDELATALNDAERELLEAKLAGENETVLSERLGLTREGVRSRWNRLKKRLLRKMQ